MDRPHVINLFADDVRQAGIAEQESAAWRDTAGLVREFFWIPFVEILKDVNFDDFGMDRSDTIDGM